MSARWSSVINCAHPSTPAKPCRTAAASTFPLRTQIDEKDGLPLEPGRFIKVSIADHGSEFHTDVVQKIFDPYFTTKTSSTGLGLAISYSIIRKHGGLLHLERQYADRRDLYLPSASRRQQSRKRSAPAQRSRFHINEKRILVMDDESAIREHLALLETMGYEVTAVPDGAEAIPDL